MTPAKAGCISFLMHLTRFTDYSLRVLVYLAVRPDGFGTVQDVAEAYDISRNHLTKVVQELNHRGYVETIRGKGGGMRLRLTPRQINVGRVVREMESELAVVECLGNGHCAISPDCLLKSALMEALEAFLKVLDRYTLADLTGNRHSLQRMLNVRVVTD
jgi:Rrf2 family transcriptional regulator, nitric oxide-sensitive transcriptional repressor